MRLSCAFAPGPATPDQVALAEDLGYERAWLYDSPALYLDVWATLARAAERTTRIGLASGVAVPTLRHVFATASALLGIEAIAPGRVTFGVGSGGTAVRLLGRPKPRWEEVRAYAEAVRSLLRGEAVEWEGATLHLMHPDGIAPPPPVEIPMVFAVEGPRGERIAREHGDGAITIRYAPKAPFPWHSRLTFGTVLEDGEDPGSERVVAAAGPGAAMGYHFAYATGKRKALDALPGGTELGAEFDAVSGAERTAAVWGGHLVRLSPRDAAHIPPAAIQKMTMTGTRAEIREAVRELAADGITELVYQPCGPDIERELRALADAVGDLAEGRAKAPAPAGRE